MGEVDNWTAVWYITFLVFCGVFLRRHVFRCVYVCVCTCVCVCVCVWVVCVYIYVCVCMCVVWCVCVYVCVVWCVCMCVCGWVVCVCVCVGGVYGKCGVVCVYVCVYIYIYTYNSQRPSTAIHCSQQSSFFCYLFRNVPGSNLEHWPAVLRHSVVVLSPSRQTGARDRFLPHSCPFTSNSTCCYEVSQESVVVFIHKHVAVADGLPTAYINT